MRRNSSSASSANAGAITISEKISSIASRQRHIEHLIHGDNATKRRLAIGRIGALPGLQRRRAQADPTRVGVLDNRQRRPCIGRKLLDQLLDGGNIENIDIGKLFAMQLLKELAEIAIQRGRLVRVFAVAQILRLMEGQRQRLRERLLRSSSRRSPHRRRRCARTPWRPGAGAARASR